MKNANIILVVLALLGSPIANAQESFCSISHSAGHQQNTLKFSVPKEKNVYQYRIMAGKDSTNMSLIGTLRPKGNSVSVQNYEYELYEPRNNYYRIVLVDMNQQYHYSSIVSTKQDIKAIPNPDRPAPSLGSPIATSK